MTIDVACEPHPDACVLTVTGDLDCSSGAALTAAIDAAVADGFSTVLLDLAPVEFMDSTGVSCLLSARLAHGDDAIQIVAMSGQVGRVLRLSGVDTLFSVPGAADAQTTARGAATPPPPPGS